MLKAVSTYVYVKERLHPGILDGLVRSGVQAIEIFAARQHFDYANRKAHVKEIAEWFRESGVPLNSVHAPLYADYEWGRAGAPPVNIASTDRAGHHADAGGRTPGGACHRRRHGAQGCGGVRTVLKCRLGVAEAAVRHGDELGDREPAGARAPARSWDAHLRRGQRRVPPHGL